MTNARNGLLAACMRPPFARGTPPHDPRLGGPSTKIAHTAPLWHPIRINPDRGAPTRGAVRHEPHACHAPPFFSTLPGSRAAGSCNTCQQREQRLRVDRFDQMVVEAGLGGSP